MGQKHESSYDSAILIKRLQEIKIEVFYVESLLLCSYWRHVIRFVFSIDLGRDEIVQSNRSNDFF